MVWGALPLRITKTIEHLNISSSLIVLFQEVVGGMIDAEPRLWRRPQKEGFEDQRKKVLQFADWWKPYDWTTQN